MEYPKPLKKLKNEKKCLCKVKPKSRGKSQDPGLHFYRNVYG